MPRSAIRLVTSSGASHADSAENRAPVTVPVPRAIGLDWPGEDEVAWVPAVLILALRGRCCCQSCVDGYVRRTARPRLVAV